MPAAILLLATHRVIECSIYLYHYKIIPRSASLIYIYLPTAIVQYHRPIISIFGKTDSLRTITQKKHSETIERA